ncbi:MAG: electron transfer flavoprotein subunit beta/FixA family protein [Caldimicrobium sp.]|nr:electron transfer flavoprotein subunit beta/FixA family protein [Caldimicrobium sp.]MCX7874457.1 electron transfer flavoprotein subunit beta/FixA family protein [Caldimicrobium sp.]MDW8094107.1 electron transfer flavoprotein subunit beta/FixA family protein [Caldimicrobium sp.]
MEKIIVCIKGVPKPETVKVDPERHILIRESAELILNPPDKAALEMAMRLKDRHGVKVTVLSMGPPNVLPILKEAFGLGADELILLSDRAFAGADTLATSRVIAQAIRTLAPYSLVLMGLKSIDGETAQVPPETASLLNLPSVINVLNIIYREGKFLVIRETNYGEEELEIEPPLVVSMSPKLDYFRPPSLKRLLMAKNLDYRTLGAVDLSLPEEILGLRGSPTKVAGVFEKVLVQRGELWKGEPEELAERFLELLRVRGFLKI